MNQPAIAEPAPDPDALPETAEVSRLLSVGVVEDPQATVVQVTIAGPFAHASFGLSQPDRFVIDLQGVVDTSSHSIVQVGQGPVEQVRVGQFSLEPDRVSRIVFDLRQSLAPKIEQSSSGLTVRF